MPLLDLEIDPITRDYIDEPDGSWRESADSRTAVLHQLEEHFGEGWADPEAGSRFHLLMRGPDDLVTEEELRDEALRALQPLVVAGLIADLRVATTRDLAERLVLDLAYLDLASGRRVGELVAPFGG